MTRPIYQALASKVVARQNCSGKNEEWFARHTQDIERLVKEWLPSGSGFDAGTKVDWDKSNAERIVFLTAYHHMNDTGMYDGWTEHAVTVKPSLCFGFTLTISGRDRNQIKDYIAQAFEIALREPEPEAVREASHG
jgi:hypothetical protein